MTDVGNAVASVPMSASPSTSTPRFVFGETSEIQPGYPTTSQTIVEWTNNLPPFLKPPKVSGEFPEFVPLSQVLSKHLDAVVHPQLSSWSLFW